MTIAQMQETARGFAARQIDRGQLSVKLLAHRAAISPSHASLFVHGHKRLSVNTLSKVLSVLGFEVEIFIRTPRQ